MTIKTLGAYAVADERTRREIEQYIENIADPQTREMFRLHFIGRLSYSQTARELGGGMTRYCVYCRVKRYAQHAQRRK